jgi:hypothetical protein
VTSSTFYLVSLLVEGLLTGGVCMLSDIVVGFTYIFYVLTCCPRSSINTFNVDCSSYTSSFSSRMVATILVCDCVDGGVSIYSMHFALYLAFSCLLFMLYSMSRMSTGCGDSACGG